MRWLVLLVLTATIARAEGETAGAFDYYVLSLSWSPTWCTLEGERRDSPQCDDGASRGWVLHGLWPQYERGWPSNCPTTKPRPSRRETRAMADIMGSPGAAWHQWNKHGRCSGLSSAEYFALSRRAYDTVNRPDVFGKLPDGVRLPAAVVEEAFLQANPGWRPDMLTITCKAGRIQEARLCLTRDLKPRLCGDDVIEDCDLRDALMEAIH
ncbi:ribonuclease T2 family protein [Rhodovulum euryhalinum]|uniref:Ribonuclease T2 n=1 Tax=Rhodovulum euryhalinum TaxID=35805 RepID=A0A4R2KEK7_9RHOB|nr:ribonuclease T2 [Rhodovulum euryhalinum]TCO71953.1 ribonuclease T2 [Rhodovulum euryhalinum]